MAKRKSSASSTKKTQKASQPKGSRKSRKKGSSVQSLRTVAQKKGTTLKQAQKQKDRKDFDFETFKDTREIQIGDLIIDQVVGQEDAVAVMKKAANQRRHVLLIGEPGTGKSMLGLALAQMLPHEKLADILAFHNPNDENQPLIRSVEGGKGRDIVLQARLDGGSFWKNQGFLVSLVFIVLAAVLSMWTFNYFSAKYSPTVGAIMCSAAAVAFMVLVGFIMMSMNLSRTMGGMNKNNSPKLIVDNFDKKHVPFYDATGAHAGALLGDVLHDPFQSGGLGTPANERVVAGMIHKANMGVLFIDEISTLEPATQQELLTALQEGKYPITGQSERSAGAMVRTEAVPCSFILVAAGNADTVQHMHPALRSRIRGYGYEVFMKETMPDTPENRKKIALFTAQEIAKDKKIPGFTREAVMYIIEEARKRANRKGHLTLSLRELGGLIRAAGDVAVEDKAELVSKDHILRAKKFARPLEQQIADKFIERKKEYEVIITEGKAIGRVNGLAVIGSGTSYSGILLPIEAEVTPGKSGEFIATGKLGEIAKEAIKNVSAIIKRYFGEDIKEKCDIYIQFLQTYEGVEGDSASIAVATAIISAFKRIPIRQDVAMTGSLSVRGEVLPIGGVTSKIEAAIEAGVKQVIVPRSNLKDIVIDKDLIGKVEITPVDSLAQVLRIALDWKGHEDVLRGIERMNKE